MAQDAAFVQHDAQGEVHVLRLANPPVNTLRTEIRAGLFAGLNAAKAAGAKAVVLIGSGRMFCAGGDIKAFLAGGEPAAAIDAITTPLHAALVRFAALEKPVITLVNGPAAGAGLGLAISGDIVLAARSAHFTSAYTAIGLTPDGGTSWLLPRLLGLRRATEIVLTNRRILAEEAEAIGLVTRVVDDADLMTEGAALADRLADGAVGALGRSRRLLMEGLNRDLASQLDIEARTIAASAAGPEGRRGIARFLDKR